MEATAAARLSVSRATTLDLNCDILRMSDVTLGSRKPAGVHVTCRRQGRRSVPSWRAQKSPTKIFVTPSRRGRRLSERLCRNP